MFKEIKRKLANYLYGVNIKDLIDKSDLNLDEIEKLHNENNKIYSSHESLVRELEESKLKFQLREKELLEEQKDTHNQIYLFKEEIAKLQGSYNLLMAENEKLLQQISRENIELTYQIKTLKDQIKKDNKTNQSFSEKITELSNDLENSNKTIDNLSSKVEAKKSDDEKQQELICSLKEIISSQQTQISNTEQQKNELSKLKQVSTNDKLLINDLKEELNWAKEEIDTINHKHTSDDEHVQIIDGVVIHKSMNVGKRTKKKFENDTNQFHYMGEFLFETALKTKSDSKEFPDVFFPKKGTPILKWHETKTSTTTGVTEPLLVIALKKIRDLVPDIEIFQNIALSIRNRDYSYLPDIALYWDKYRLIIDIEIDEPYDLVTRKPLHYQGSSDYLRNLYFISQGWVVIRISEEQVVTNADGCVNYILSVFKHLTKDDVFVEIDVEQTIDKATRWTFDQAKELEEQKHREHYLKIDFESIESMESAYDEFTGIAPESDILPKIDYSGLESKLKSINSKYIRVSSSDFGIQQIFENYEIDKQDFMDGIKGFNVVEERHDFVKFEIVTQIEGIDSPFKSSLYNRVDIKDDIFSEILNEAIYNANPIRIEYKDGSSNTTFRNLTLMSYLGDSKEYLCDYIWQNYYNTKSSMIIASCLLRNAQRSFYIYRIQSIQVFDVKYLGIGHFISFSSALWYPLIKNDFNLCEHITKLAPKYMTEKDIKYRGNYAHYLVLSGNVDEAVKIYKAHIGVQVAEGLDWVQMNLKDFEDLSVENESYKTKFDKVKLQLKW